MGLDGNVVNVTELKDHEIKEMFELMRFYYHNVTDQNFRRDLSEKEWAILLKNEKQEIKGFSTMMLIDFNIKGENIKGVFSGDTIIDREYWGLLELPVVWGSFVVKNLPKQFPDSKVYWILITKGFKTYRYLPRYFLEYYPRYDRQTPEFEKKLIDAFGMNKYNGRFDSEKGIIYSDGTTDALKEGVADITEKHLNNPNIRFFVEKNPGYNNGDELVCVTRASMDNLEPEIKGILESLN